MSCTSARIIRLRGQAARIGTWLWSHRGIARQRPAGAPHEPSRCAAGWEVEVVIARRRCDTGCRTCSRYPSPRRLGPIMAAGCWLQVWSGSTPTGCFCASRLACTHEFVPLPPASQLWCSHIPLVSTPPNCCMPAAIAVSEVVFDEQKARHRASEAEAVRVEGPPAPLAP